MSHSFVISTSEFTCGECVPTNPSGGREVRPVRVVRRCGTGPGCQMIITVHLPRPNTRSRRQTQMASSRVARGRCLMPPDWSMSVSLRPAPPRRRRAVAEWKIGRGRVHHVVPHSHFHVASHEYAACFRNLPQPDTQWIRGQAMDYLETFDAQLWHEEPVVSILCGERMSGKDDLVQDTRNALGVVNGRQILAGPDVVSQLAHHIRTYQSTATDLRTPIRQLELELWSESTGFLIGNQCVDFQKQDGVTEVEEAIMANVVEQRLNDLLLADEVRGQLVVHRKPIYVSCVSNFTNFLDLSRKTLRSLECGIPCLVLARSNTQQHSFRWTELLVRLLNKYEVDPGMLTFLSCHLDDIKAIIQTNVDSTGNLYATCSRELAADITSTYPHTVASTGGPNTLITTTWTPQIQDAIRTSATIESAGQCTALRHCVVPPAVADRDLYAVLARTAPIAEATEALRHGQFDGVFENHQGSDNPDSNQYTRISAADAFVRIGDTLPECGLDEYWRKVTVDFTRLDPCQGDTAMSQLVYWLNENQPISLAVNGPRRDAIRLGIKLFDQTGLVVCTIGSSDHDQMLPALTCQARPQTGEIFGEVPPRRQLHRWTKFPVLVPTSNPSYDAVYTNSFLTLKASKQVRLPTTTLALFNAIESSVIKGYCHVLLEYLQNVSRLNPKLGTGLSRTVLWGLQRPPIQTYTIVRARDNTSWDDIAPMFLLFHCTNARGQIQISIDPRNDVLRSFCSNHNLPFVVETMDKMSERSNDSGKVFDVIHPEVIPEDPVFPMIGNFVSLYMSFGHIKSTMAGDNEFAFIGRLSRKWLQSLF